MLARMARRILISLGVGLVVGACLLVVGALATKTRRMSGVDIGDYWRIVLIGLVAGIIATGIAVVLTSPRASQAVQAVQAGAVVGGVILLLVIELPQLGFVHVHGGRYACQHQGLPPDAAWDSNAQSDVVLRWSWVPFGFTCEVTTKEGGRHAWHLNWGDTFGAEGWHDAPIEWADDTSPPAAIALRA